MANGDDKFVSLLSHKDSESRTKSAEDQVRIDVVQGGEKCLLEDEKKMSGKLMKDGLLQEALDNNGCDIFIDPLSTPAPTPAPHSEAPLASNLKDKIVSIEKQISSLYHFVYSFKLLSKLKPMPVTPPYFSCSTGIMAPSNKVVGPPHYRSATEQRDFIAECLDSLTERFNVVLSLYEATSSVPNNPKGIVPNVSSNADSLFEIQSSLRLLREMLLSTICDTPYDFPKTDSKEIVPLTKTIQNDNKRIMGANSKEIVPLRKAIQNDNKRIKGKEATTIEDPICCSIL